MDREYFFGFDHHIFRQPARHVTPVRDEILAVQGLVAPAVKTSSAQFRIIHHHVFPKFEILARQRQARRSRRRFHARG